MLRQTSPQLGSQNSFKGLVSRELTACCLWFLPLFWLSKKAMLPKHVNQIIWITKLSKTKLYQYSRSSFGFYWMWMFRWIKVSLHPWDKLGWLNWFWYFPCEGLSFFNPKGLCYSYTWSCSLCEGGTCFCTGLTSRKLSEFLFMFLTSFNSFRVLLIFRLLIVSFFMTNAFWCCFI